MYVRIARWEHADPEEVRASAERMRGRVEGGPPEGVPSTGLLYLVDPEHGRTMAIGFFETEEELRKGDEVLDRMSPPPDERIGERTSVEMYEVAVEVRLPVAQPR